MTSRPTHNKEQTGPPVVRATAEGDIDTRQLADVIEWFLNFDERVALIRHPAVNEVFQWKQAASSQTGDTAYMFRTAEDRLAIGVLQALAEARNEIQLHAWISQLLDVLQEATSTNEQIAENYSLEKIESDSTVSKASSIPDEQERMVYLNYCWLEAQCTAEVRILGWVYENIYSRPFHPNNF